MIMAESTIFEDLDTSKVELQSRYFKAKVLEDHQTEKTGKTFKNGIAEDEIIVFTDQNTSYVNIAYYVDIHISEKSNETTTKKTLKWVHIAINNAKRNFSGNLS